MMKIQAKVSFELILCLNLCVRFPGLSAVNYDNLSAYFKGHLSSRMTGEDNTWRQTWNQAQPRPACRQKMLFDDLKAANKVIAIHFNFQKKISNIA